MDDPRRAHRAAARTSRCSSAWITSAGARCSASGYRLRRNRSKRWPGSQENAIVDKGHNANTLRSSAEIAVEAVMSHEVGRSTTARLAGQVASHDIITVNTPSWPGDGAAAGLGAERWQRAGGLAKEVGSTPRKTEAEAQGLVATASLGSASTSAA
jgi:hypothetical protein